MSAILTERQRLVITGFGPFGHHAHNPSWDVARAFADVLGHKAHHLSVTYTAAAQFAAAHLRSHPRQSTCFLHFGLRADGRHIDLEGRAINERDGRPDTVEARHGASLPPAQTLVDAAPRVRSSGLDLPFLADCYNQGRPAVMPTATTSDDCGRYVCNALYYHSLNACDRQGAADSHALFIHVPAMTPVSARRVGRYLANCWRPSSASQT